MTISYEDSIVTLFFKWKANPKEELGLKYYFEQLVPIFESYSERLPITFILGFYVTQIIQRWWTQFQLISWPEDLLSVVYMIIVERDEAHKRIKHQITRYLNVANVLAWRDISSQVRIRFPSVRNLVKGGLLTEKEFNRLEHEGNISGARWMVPLTWIQEIMSTYVEANHSRLPLVGTFLSELQKTRASVRNLYCHDWVPIPLVYTHIAALATYSYFGFALIGRQFTDKSTVDLVIPVFTMVQFITYVGWLKVGLDLLRPFGDDDDDIELGYILDRNLEASFAFTHKIHPNGAPDFENDEIWQHYQDETNPHLSRVRNKIQSQLFNGGRWVPQTINQGRAFIGEAPRLHAYVTIGHHKLLQRRRHKKSFISW
ncbi:unnamed protein product, partial [Mesorhabditis belari]|uniref:Bestrophin homolog n=1 Tax=Mesorhabditis belari TaxID=2138241 RepID=A0AAF3FLG7_9BILA